MIQPLKVRSSLTRHIAGALVTMLFVLAAAPGPTRAQSSERTVVGAVAAQLEGLPEQSLKDVYVQCSDQAIRAALGFGEAALCSMVYETLLRRIFGGDFHALLAWSRIQEDSKEAVPVGITEPVRR